LNKFDNPLSNKTLNSSADGGYLLKLSKIVFIVCMFFVIFGTSLPFKHRAGAGVEVMSESNLINQIVFSGIFILSVITLIPKINSLKLFFKVEGILFLFLFWCFATIFWSEHPLVSFKRYFQFITIIIVILSIIIYVKDIDKIFKLVKYIFILYLFVSIVTIVTVPKAIDNFGNLRGIAPTKNNFGQILLLISLTFFLELFKNDIRKRIAYFFIFFISLILLLGSNSITSILTFFSISFLFLIIKLKHQFEYFGMGKMFFVFSLIFLLAITTLTIFYPEEILGPITSSIGKDLTLTGRVDIWIAILIIAKPYILFGCGFQGFWVKTNPFLAEWWESNNWLLTSAHNGYIDMINEIGIIGFILFFLLIIRFFMMFYRSNSRDLLLLLMFIIGLILNLTESTILRPKHAVSVILFLSYFILAIKYKANHFLEKLTEN